jgi:tetratricopeptide (TPR) repeat protein
MELFREAHAMSATAQDEAAFGTIIKTCRSGMQAGVSPSDAVYGRKLMAWAFNKRGELRADAGDAERAMEDFQAAARLDDRHWRAVHNRGVSYALQGKYREAIADFDRAVELNPKYANAWFNRGEAHYEQGDYQAAVRDYTAALRLSPNDAAAHNSRGHALYRLRRYRDAVREYDRAVAIDPKSAAARINRADAHADLGAYAEAARDYRAAIELEPESGRAYLGAAWLMATCPEAAYRNADLAVKAATKAIELDGDRDYRYLETLAAAQASAGEFDAAARTQVQAAALAPKNVAREQQERVALYERSTVYVEPARQPSPPTSTGRRGMSRRPTP